MIYGSVCSGIEAATVAWEPLGWEPAFFAEIDPYPNKLLAHHYPTIPNLGDFTQIEKAQIDLLVGGTPCQDFSVAGLRAGLAGNRGQLSVQFCELLGRVQPRWFLWENVPGVLSADRGLAFGIFLHEVAKIGYRVCWRVLDAQYFGVPQRRKRVYVVGYLGDWRPPAAVLFEPESLPGNITASGSAGQVVGTLLASGAGTARPSQRTNEHVIIAPAVANTLGARGQRLDLDNETYVAFSCKDNGRDAVENITPTLRAMNYSHSSINGGGQLAVSNGFIARRLTPLECERLQGFPDGYTEILKSDTRRYRALGNSFAVPVIRWIGQRIDAVEKIKQQGQKN